MTAGTISIKPNPLDLGGMIILFTGQRHKGTSAAILSSISYGSSEERFSSPSSCSETEAFLIPALFIVKVFSWEGSEWLRVDESEGVGG